MPGRSILFSATTIGTSAARAWLIASSVCGITPSSAATTSTAISVTLAPRARISVNASWPGVSTNEIRLPSFSIVYARMCCVMPPLSPLTTSMPMMRSNSDVLPWSTWPRNVITGGRSTRSAGSSSCCSKLGEHLVFQADRLLELDVDAQLGRHELRHFRIHDGGDRRHDAFVHQDPQDFARRHAGRFGQFANRARQLNGDVLLARRRRARASADLAPRPATKALRPIVFADGRRGAAPRELTLFAATQHRASSFFLAFASRAFPAAMLRFGTAILFGFGRRWRGGAWGSQALQPALLLFFVERAFVTTQDAPPAALRPACRRRERRPAIAGRAFARVARAVVGCGLGCRRLRHRRELDGRAGPFASAVDLLAIALSRLGADDRHFASRRAGADVFFAAHRAGQRARAAGLLNRNGGFDRPWKLQQSGSQSPPALRPVRRLRRVRPFRPV